MKPTNNYKISKHSDHFNDPSINKYITLLQRLDEKEGLYEPSTEEKLKFAEDLLRLSCAKFCEAASVLLQDERSDGTKISKPLEPQAVQKLFQPVCFEPSLRPPKSELRSLHKEEKLVCNLKSTTSSEKKDYADKKKLQQAYYLPPTSWFSSDKASTDLSNEEVELLSSCATKAFVRFLEDRRKEIPRIFTLPPQYKLEKE